MNLQPTIKVNDLKDNQIFETQLFDESIILIKTNGKVKAYSSTCPHQGADLAQGTIENNHLVCPMHGKQFSCETGKENNTELCLKPYPLEIKDGIIHINSDPWLKNETQQKHLKQLSDLPSPKGKFVTGNLADFKRSNKHQVFENWSKELGDIYQISLMGKRIVISTNPTFNGHVLKNRPSGFRRFSKIKEVMEEMGIEGVFSTEGEEWKKHRKVTAEALSMKNVKAYFPVIQQMTHRLMKRWDNIAAQKTTLDVQHEMMLYTVDITTFIAFGYDTNTLESDGDVIQNHLKKVFPMVNKRIAAPLPLWRYFKSKKDKELDVALSEIKAKVNEYIQATKLKLAANPNLKENPTNFLEALLVEQEKDYTFTDKDIFGNVFIILLAGEDTTSNTISWAIYYLLKNPKVKERLCNELDEVLQEKRQVSTIEELDALKYTEAVAMETLRINPTTPTLIMQANQSTEVHGWEIPKDTTLLLQNKVAQTQDEHFVDANQFIPERWLQTSSCPMHGNHNTDVMRVFGAGPRFCPGKNLALYEMKMALAMICKNYDFKFAVHPKDINEVFAFTMYPENLKVTLTSKVNEYILS